MSPSSLALLFKAFPISFLLIMSCKSAQDSKAGLKDAFSPIPSEWKYRCDHASGKKVLETMYFNIQTPDGKKGLNILYNIPGGTGRTVAKKGRDQSGDRIEYKWDYSDDYVDIKYTAKIDTKLLAGDKKGRISVRAEEKGKKKDEELTCKSNWQDRAAQDSEAERKSDENANYPQNNKFKYRCKQTSGAEFFGSDLVFLAPGSQLKMLFTNHDGGTGQNFLDKFTTQSNGNRTFEFSESGEYENAIYQLVVPSGLISGKNDKGTIALTATIDDESAGTATLTCQLNKN